MARMKEIATAGGRIPRGAGTSVEVQGLIAIMADMTEYTQLSDSHETEMVHSITGGIRTAGQQRSPYLTGALRSAHRDMTTEVSEGGEESLARGVVFIDPSVYNAITQGWPYIYGKDIHDSRNPWFGDVVAQEAPGIIQHHGATLIEWWRDVLPGN
jgi:hypothetical protein